MTRLAQIITTEKISEDALPPKKRRRKKGTYTSFVNKKTKTLDNNFFAPIARGLGLLFEGQPKPLGSPLRLTHFGWLLGVLVGK